MEKKSIFILFSVGEIFNSKKNNFAFKISVKQWAANAMSYNTII